MPRAIPPEYGSVTPYLIVPDGDGALAFYAQAFGAVEHVGCMKCTMANEHRATGAWRAPYAISANSPSTFNPRSIVSSLAA